MVAHKLGEIVENMEFLMVHDGKENKTMLSGNQLQHLLEAREILNPTYGRCFEIDLAKLNQTIESVSIATIAYNLCHDNRQLIVLAINCNHSDSKNNCN